MGRGGEEGWKVSGGARGRFGKQGQARTTGRREGPRRPQAGQGPGYPGQTSPNGIERVGEEAVVRMGGNRGLRPESVQNQRAGPCRGGPP